MIELESIASLERVLASGGALSGCVLQDLDLRGHTERLLAADLRGAVFLGCALEPALTHAAVEAGALLFPPLPGLPFDPYRSRLYPVEALYDRFDPARPESYAECLDARVYRYWKDVGGAAPASILDTLAQRLHDHAISDALEELLRPEGGPAWRVVAIMGGHGMGRHEPAYADVARIARALTREGFLCASGGGPGAMEATHLGAFLAPRPDEALDEALGLLAAAPRFADREWLSQAFRVRERFPLSAEEVARHPSLGVPTWLYGHEPPNAFATLHAKYFANSVREDGLLAIAKHGVIFTPGSAGTIQEIFQDACQNHYVTCGVASPMVFLGRDFWTRETPVYPLLERLAAGRDYARHLSIHDAPGEAVDAIRRFAAEAG